MKQKIQWLAILWLFLVSLLATPQQRVDYNGTSKIQYGFSTKLIVDIAGRKKQSNIRIGIASGVGFSLYNENLTSLNVEYSAAIGGLGTYNNGKTCYFVISPNFCQSLYRNHFNDINDPLINNQPLYYFTDLITPPLQNPFYSSVSIGTNFIRFINKNQTHKWQMVAHLSLKLNAAQLAYNNDGGLLLKIWGDKEDRYFTGGGFLRIHLKDNRSFNSFGISFYKFTGYSPMSFEISDELLYLSADYKDPKQNFFNRGFWSFNAGNSRYGDVFIRYNNPRNIREVQNFIHYNMGFGYHQTLEDSFMSFGGSYNYYQTHIPVK